jgi:hypothetical protein
MRASEKGNGPSKNVEQGNPTVFPGEPIRRPNLIAKVKKLGESVGCRKLDLQRRSHGMPSFGHNNGSMYVKAVCLGRDGEVESAISMAV